MEDKEKGKMERERWRLLIQVRELLEIPMIVLGFAWLLFMILELTRGLDPILEKISISIWILFILEFILAFVLAPAKRTFLKKNVLTAISLVVPAFRLFRILRFLRFFRSMRLVKVIGSLNRSMRSLAATMQRRAFGYMFTFSLLVILGGAAGMYAFENHQGGINSYRQALWWTAMIVITVGTEYWPVSPEGRILCFCLALYGFAILGYITATIATFFLGKDAVEKNEKETLNEVRLLRKEISELRDQLRK
jgi:voltage-gated potassium channel